MKYHLQSAPLLLLLLLGSTPSLYAQASVDYNDVALIVNDNSDVSKAISEYFRQKRKIPQRNIIHITTSSNETVDSVTFENIRSQIETYLTTNDMVDTINYLVTTKGMPLRINRSNPSVATSNRSSLESDLMLILGPLSQYIGGPGPIQLNQGYFGSKLHFSRSLLPIYLVTRLDGYTTEDIYRMIDRSGPNTLVDKQSATFILDQDPTPIDGNYNLAMRLVAPLLVERGWNVVLDSSKVYLTEQKNVIGYASWGSNDDNAKNYAENAKPLNTWSPGSLAETYVSTSARSFQPGTTYGQSLIADLIVEGVAGVKGYVFEPTTAALAQVQVLFERYTDSAQDTRFNMAESYAMASPLYSWMDVVIGDPKTSIITSLPPMPAPTIATAVTACSGDSLHLEAPADEYGLHDWYDADSVTVQTAGPPFDNHHPNWIGSGRTLALPPKMPGTYTFTHRNENITGTGFAEVTVTVAEAPIAQMSVPDTVKIGDTVQCLASGGTSYLWDFGDGTPVSEEAAPRHSFATIGQYTLIVTVSNGSCSTSITKRIIVRAASGVESSVGNIAIRVAPNPTAEDLTISIDSEIPGTVTLRLFDAEGRVLLHRTVQAAESAQERLSLREYPSGIYMLEIDTKAGVRRERIVRVR